MTNFLSMSLYSNRYLVIKGLFIDIALAIEIIYVRKTHTLIESAVFPVLQSRCRDVQPTCTWGKKGAEGSGHEGNAEGNVQKTVHYNSR